MSRAKFDDLQGVIGINFNPHGLLFSRPLFEHVNLIDTVTYDWMHSMLQDGAHTFETGLILEVVRLPTMQSSVCSAHGLSSRQLRPGSLHHGFT